MRPVASELGAIVPSARPGCVLCGVVWYDKREEGEDIFRVLGLIVHVVKQELFFSAAFL